MLDYKSGQGLNNYTNKCINKTETPPDAKPLKGFGGAGVLELIEDHRGNTYRAVYTVRFATRIYVLHAFQKKSKRGIVTPKRELEPHPRAA